MGLLPRPASHPQRGRPLPLACTPTFSSHLLSGTLTPQVFQPSCQGTPQEPCSRWPCPGAGLGGGSGNRGFSRNPGDLRPGNISMYSA